MKKWVFAALSLLLLLPFPRRSCPEWDVQVQDEMARPLAGVRVEITYQNAAAEWRPHRESLVTDAEGRVRFDQHMHYAPGLQYVVRTISQLPAIMRMQGNTGRFAFVSVDAPGRIGLDQQVWLGSPGHMHSRVLTFRAGRN